MRASRRVILLLVAAAVTGLSGCAQTSQGEAIDEPAKLTPVGDGTISQIDLTEHAAERLGIEVAQLQTVAAVQTRRAIGEVVSSAIAAAEVVTAPGAGAISAPAGGALPHKGARLTKGQVVLRWTSLVRTNGAPRVMNITAPSTSVLVRLDVAAGDVVAGGQALFEVADPTRIWVRVAVSEAEAARVDRSLAATILPSSEASTPIAAHLVQPPDTGDAPGSYAGTALYYGFDGKATGATLGDRMRVELPLIGSGAQRLAVPYSALLYDLKGNAWVYTSPKDLHFVRAAVKVAFIDGDRVILESGPPPGTRVVTVGASELYGTEFGVGE